MELTAAIELIRNASFAQTKSTWADLGSGSGLFTYALASLLPDGSMIYAIDKSRVVLNQYPKPAQTIIQPLQADFITQDLPLPILDGILMANSFHYVKEWLSLVN
jgi:trans-aconitate methyltransferase